MDNKAIVTINNADTEMDHYLQKPGDKITKEVKPSGDIITKVDTEQIKFTRRQYTKKDGTRGKQTVTLMQPDKGER